MKEHFKQLIQSHLELLGEKPIAAATKRGLNRDVFRTILRGHPPTIERADEICRALGWELYIGPPRGDGAPAVAAVQPMAETIEDPDLQGVKAARDVLARIEARLERTAVPILDDLGAVGADGGDARPVEVMDLAAAAGAGAEADDERVTGWRWFQRGWLAARGLDPKSCRVIGVRGESMEPTLPDGCSILVDQARRALQDNQIFVLRGPDGLITKRAARNRDDGGWCLRGDHPTWPDMPWSPDLEVIGLVVWMTRSL